MSTQTCKLKYNQCDDHQISSNYFRPPIVICNQYIPIKIHWI
jgi:hypothetical protein